MLRSICKPGATPAFWKKRGLIACLLLPFTLLYRMIFALRYHLAKRTAYRAPVPVLCIGNATAGGAGKTPTAMAVISLLREKNINAHCISRGYGAEVSGCIRVDPDRHSALEVGDEPLLLAKCAPTWVCKDRKAAIRAAIDAGAEMVILDDGLQNPSIIKDYSLLVINGITGLGNGLLLPAGPLREPLPRLLPRVNALWIIDAAANIPGFTHEIAPAIPRFHAKTVAEVAHLPKDTSYIAFAGMAYPEKFYATLENYAIKVVAKYDFPDHYPYTETDITTLLAKAEKSGARLITTEKDSVRIPSLFRDRILVLPIRTLCNQQEQLYESILPFIAHKCARPQSPS